MLVVSWNQTKAALQLQPLLESPAPLTLQQRRDDPTIPFFSTQNMPR